MEANVFGGNIWIDLFSIRVILGLLLFGGLRKNIARIVRKIAQSEGEDCK